MAPKFGMPLCIVNARAIFQENHETAGDVTRVVRIGGFRPVTVTDISIGCLGAAITVQSCVGFFTHAISLIWNGLHWV